jgi:hypothetical protein
VQTLRVNRQHFLPPLDTFLLLSRFLLACTTMDSPSDADIIARNLVGSR